MKLNILQIICLINYVVTFPNDLFDELWQTNQSELQANHNPIEYQPKIKIEPHEEKFDGRWQDESALKGIVKVEHLGAVKVEGTVKIKHEFESWDEESGEFKEQLVNHVKEEVQEGQAPITFDQKKIGDEDENWEEDENNSAPSADDLDQDNSKNLSDQNNSTDQNESNDEQQNESNKFEKIESDQQKREIIQKFREMKEDYTQKRKYSSYQHIQIENKILNGLGVSRTTIYEWRKELDLIKRRFSELEKRKILKQFDEIKSKCQKAKITNISMNELDGKIANKLGVSRHTIYVWKRKFGLSVCNKKFSDATKIGILKKYTKIKRNNPKMSDSGIADLLKISRRSINKWKSQFSKEIRICWPR